MDTPTPHRSAHRPPNRKPLALLTNAAMCAAVIVALGASTPIHAGADPDPGDDGPNPFGGLSCSCAQTSPAGAPAQRQQLIGGLQQGLAVGQREPNLASSPATPPA
ncbi:hypothetical protein MINTM008_22540 [Mycobacterium intracellulare]|nr:hypothetical protein MPRI_37080 [Mycobacterium paraintracellulare]BCO46339.1 hypothetical protein MINTM002_20130 [Mycobacterium intracellulare]BCO40988.1 hypothetical protein MINTM001_21270 [Mycobacterium paraintracellulare]BCO51474.1 hypothetical protein MINTM003_19150 [Mycobacterium paraintracellulare]BCO62165.1 hypothetical protein MINTM006_21150 [Mycobacterium intracellulare]